MTPFKLTCKRIIFMIKNKNNISKFIDIVINKTINNETIGESAELALSKVHNISCTIDTKRTNPIITKRLYQALLNTNIKLPSPIVESCGAKNGSVDFKLENGETLSLKTLKNKDGKVCPQKCGQPTLRSWDKQWGQPFNGELSNNPKRWKFIRDNIYTYLNRMLQGVFCCDHLMIIKNCFRNPTLEYFGRNDIPSDYFNNQTIIFTREEYEERFNVKRKKNSEMSCTIKMILKEEEIRIGEFQFHKSSRQQVKFRFYNTFLDELF